MCYINPISLLGWRSLSDRWHGFALSVGDKDHAKRSRKTGRRDYGVHEHAIVCVRAGFSRLDHEVFMKQARHIELETRRADPDKRTVPATISSEYAVKRGAYDEILLHGAGNVDLSRAPLPLIESHDGATLNIGSVENLAVSNKRLRGTVRFGSSNRGSEIWNDVVAGIVRNVSVGYIIDTFEDDGDTLRATRWTPHEVSLVSVPADPSAGLNRTYSGAIEMPDEQTQARSQENSDERKTRNQRRAERSALEAEQQRTRDLVEMGKQYDARDLAQDAVAGGTSIDQFQQVLLERMNKDRGKPLSAQWDGGYRDRRQYSVAKAVRCMIDPRSVDAGYELEVSQELTRQFGKKPRGIYMPMGQMTRAFSGVSVSGAPEMVGTDHLGSSFIDALRERSVVMMLGPKLFNGLTADISIPRLTESSKAYWLKADGSDAITESKPVFDAVTLSPLTVGALVMLSRKMILQGDPDAEQVVRDDLARVLATEIDRVAI
jgi:HK97 family phage prohead protease